MSSPEPVPDSPTADAPAGARGPGSLLVACGALLAVAWIGWMTQLHAGHWVDDAYIGFRYAEHLRAGLGFVWNVGEAAVEGVTNLGWTLLLVPFAGSAALPQAAKLLGLALLLAALWLTSRTHRLGATEAGALERALLPLLLASQAELVYYSIGGMETGLAAALVAGYLAAAGGRRWWLAGTLAGALLLVRPEAVLVPVLHLALSFAPPASGREARRLRRGLGLAFVALAAVTAWRLASFGVPWPNTFVAKPPGAPADLVGRLAALLAAGNVNLPLPYTGLGFLAVAPLGWLALRRSARELADAAAAVALTGVVFAIYAPADWTETGRFFAPWVPAAALLGVRGVFVAAGRLLGSRGPRPARAVAATLVLAAVAGGTWRSLDLFSSPRTERRPGYVTVSETLLPTVEHLARTLPRDATLASRRLGALGYFTELAIFDYSNGLTDAAVARLVRANGGELGTPRHPLLAELWRERAPEYVLEDLDVVADWLDRGESPQAFEIHGISYRLARTFPLGDGRSRWALLARADAAVPPPLPEPERR